MADSNILIKRYNGASYDTIFPKTSASQVNYNNSLSHLNADNVQNAIDELVISNENWVLLSTATANSTITPPTSGTTHTAICILQNSDWLFEVYDELILMAKNVTFVFSGTSEVSIRGYIGLGTNSWHLISCQDLKTITINKFIHKFVHSDISYFKLNNLNQKSVRFYSPMGFNFELKANSWLLPIYGEAWGYRSTCKITGNFELYGRNIITPS